MDTSDSVDTSKMKDDSTQIPSPTSSIHSIRPLEWDSGADIGYQCKLDSGLSTVERIAFVSGTVNLLENCKHTDRQFSKERRRHLGGPLAQSSPVLATVTVSKDVPAASKNEQCFPKLVDYSISEDHTLDQTEGSQMVKWFSEVNVLHKANAAIDEDPKILTLENSKSLDDLYSLKRSNHVVKMTRHSIITPKHISNKSSKEILSSSSAATLVPHLGARTRLDGLRSSSESTKDATRTYSVGSKKGSPCETENENSCGGGSLDGGSFEYVPGSMYDSRMISNRGMSNNSSSLNTLSSEVIDGVDLLIDYVNNLRIPHKRQVLQKVTKFLSTNENVLTKVRASSEESRRVTSGPASDDLFDDKSNTKSCLPSSGSKSSIRSNSKTDFSSNVVSSCSSNNYSHSQFPVKPSKQQRVRASETSNRRRSNNNNSLSSSCLVETSSCRYHSSCSLQSSDSSKCVKRETHSSNTYTLKQYLMKERNSHLMWIKSNIDHLNNLKKLCESQKVLRNELDSLKKANDDGDSNCIITPKIKPGDPSRHKKTTTKKKLLQQKQLREAKNISSTPEKEISSSLSGVYSLQSVHENTVSRNCSKLHAKRRNSRRSEMPPPPPPQDVNENGSDRECRCSCRHCCQSANKENIPTTLDVADESKRKASCRWSGECKSAVGYTLLFDKKTGVTASRKFKVEKYVRNESTTKKRQTKNQKLDEVTTSTTELEHTSYETRSAPVFSLQEYLTQNRPNYVNRAEYRRECLAEIGKLRELRDKSRQELLLAVRNVDEMDINTMTRSLPPAPMSIFKIFDEKAMKEETRKKYQQLPEVQNKKVQVKRKLNYRHNQLLAEIYAKKLQKKVLRGQVHLANDVNLMSS